MVWLMADERESLDWSTYGVAARELAAKVADDGYRPDIILAIARGGLFVAGSMGYALSVKNLYVMNVEFYTPGSTNVSMSPQRSRHTSTSSISPTRKF